MQIRKKYRFEVSSCLIRHEKPNWNFCIHFQELCKILCFMYIIFVAFPLGSGIMWSDKYIFFVCDWQSLDYFQGSVWGLCVWGPRLPSSGSWPFPPLGLEYPLITAVNTQSNLIVRFGILHMILMATFGNVN